MKLRCIAECINIYKKSSSPAFRDLKIGDVINFSINIESVGKTSHGTHAAYINCYNPRTNQASSLSFNQIERVLANFEFREI